MELDKNKSSLFHVLEHLFMLLCNFTFNIISIYLLENKIWKLGITGIVKLSKENIYRIYKIILFFNYII